jgi:membrane protease YdiL (CAAX protease family)
MRMLRTPQQPRAIAAALPLCLLAATVAMLLAPLSPAVRHALVLLLWAPIAEEVLFRWGLQEALLRWWPTRAGVITLGSAALFAASHALTRDAAWGALYLVPGLVLALLYTARRSLTYCVLLHAAMNAAYLVWMA